MLSILCCGASAAVFAAPALAAAVDVSNVERGSPAQYVKVTGRGFTGEALGSSLRVRIAEIRLESTGKLPALRYSALGIAVYKQGKIVGASWNHDVQGELTASAPAKTLAGQMFVVSWAGEPCLEGGCEARLQLRVETGPDITKAHAEHTDFAALQVTVAKLIAKPDPRAAAKRAPPKAAAKPAPAPVVTSGPEQAPRRTVEREVDRALAAYSANRRGEAEKELEAALAIAIVGRKVRANHPMAAVLLYQASSEHYERQKMPTQQEQALRWSLEILESRPDAEVKAALDGMYNPPDKEIVARRLADFYWNARRYDEAYLYYDRAYRYASEMHLSNSERNLRLARNSAGRMAGACTQGKWAVADQAMKELKERMVSVDAETRKQLEYWVRTGEPRLAARKC